MQADLPGAAREQRHGDAPLPRNNVLLNLTVYR